MKKLNHKERLNESLENVKSIKTKKPLLSRKGKRITRASIIGLGTAGIVAAASVGIYKSATASKESAFPFHAEDMDATRFQAKGATTKIVHKQSGASVVTTAQRGGVKFISNYDGMFNDDKLTDLADWFYKDVNWGPEIASLHGINLLSGVQEEDGKVTLGYHTTSRDGSIIVMSPDVIFDKTEPYHAAQQLAYWYTNIDSSFTATGDYAGDQGYRTLADDVLNDTGSDNASRQVFDQIVRNIVNYSWKQFGANGANFESFTTKMKDIINNWSSDNDKNINSILSILPSEIDNTTLLNSFSGATDNNSRLSLLRTYVAQYLQGDKSTIPNAAVKYISTILNAPWIGTDDKLDVLKVQQAILKSVTFDDIFVNEPNLSPYRTQIEDLFKDNFGDFEKAAQSTVDQTAIKKLISDNLGHIKKIIGNDEFYTIVANKSFRFSGADEQLMVDNGMDATLADAVVNYSYATDLENDGSEDPHFRSQLQALRLGGDDQVAKTLSNLLISFGHNDENATKDEQLFYILKAAALMIVQQGDRFGSTELYGLPASTMSLGSNALLNLYKELIWKNKNDLINISAGDLINMIHDNSITNIQWSDSDVSVTPGQVSTAVQKVKEVSFKYGTALNEDLQKRLKPGNQPDGTHNPGVAIWKNGDTPYDSLVRRAMTDMEYTISHEYGHHLTMTYEQDISDPKDVMVNSEALTMPSEDSLSSRWRYNEFMSAFKTDWFKETLTAATDGDTRTDVGYQAFDGEGLAGDLGIKHLDYVAAGVHGENQNKPNVEVLLPFIQERIDLAAPTWSVSAAEVDNQAGTAGDYLLNKLVLPLEEGKILSPNRNSYDWIPDNINISFGGGTMQFRLYAQSCHLNNYLCDVYEQALKIIAPGTPPNASTLYQAADIIAGKYTRSLFDKMVTDYVEISITGDTTNKKYHLNDLYKDDSATGLNNQIAFVDIIKSALSTIQFLGVKDEATAKADVKDELIKKFNAAAAPALAGKATIELTNAGAQQIVDDLFDRKLFLFKLSSANSVASVQFVFNQAGDETKYKRVFSTVTKGSTPPSSFSRYQITYVETLTRLLQQTSFAVDAELLTAPGEYYAGDQMRFAMFGEDFYDVMKRGVDDPTGARTAQGDAAKLMWQKYFGMDSKITTMLHSKDTGLSSVYGFIDKTDQSKYDHLVFEDANGNIVSSAEMIYGVDNYHVYKQHGDVTSSEEMDDSKVSWTTNGMVIGDFSNSQLPSGTYKLAFGLDKNKDGKITKDEIVEDIKNGDVTHNGVTNNNGRSDATAEMEGNPNDITDPNTQFEIKVNKVRV